MDTLQMQLEISAFGEKIALSKLEEAKAHERTLEIEYEFARFNMECARAFARQQQEQQKANAVN